ncbi:sulfotransferase domain-containing protein [Granulosicoccaceae sp. 1_MG-2023]|nr:sulfotransferase domain-containing protein [Granulosicoccaceae sp. 1_MG-2023]
MTSFPELSNTPVICFNGFSREFKKDRIEAFRVQSPLEGDWLSRQFFVRGWLISKTPVKAFHLFDMQGRYTSRVAPHEHYEDVHARFSVDFPDLDKKIAFSFKLRQQDISFLEDGAALFLYAEHQDGTLEKVARLNLSVGEVDLAQALQDGCGPSFYIGGAMKGATSAIYEYLASHPSVVPRYPKEVHFFSKSHEYEKGWAWYLGQFNNAANRYQHREGVSPAPSLIGDASPSYLTDTHAPARIARYTPGAKVVLSLRNPSLRAISHYFHEVKRVGDESRPPEEVFSAANLDMAKTVFEAEGYDLDKLQAHPFWPTLRYFTEGLYGVYLQNWQDAITPENLLVVNYHLLESAPQEYVSTIFAFLGLDVPEGFEVAKIYANDYPDLDDAIVARLDEFFEFSNAKLAGLLQLPERWF